MSKSKQRARVVLQPSLGDQPSIWYAYQRYYAMGLRALHDVRFSCETLVDGTLANAHEGGLRGTHAAWNLATRYDDGPRVARETHVARYTFQFPDMVRPLRVAIDAHDGRDIRDPDALEWSQLYFKTSYWPSLNYGAKVRPLIAGNGALDARRLRRLVQLRDAPRDLDLVLAARLWPGEPGSPTCWNSVEHLVRVFETLAKLKLRSRLCAIVPQLEGDVEFPRAWLQRLADAGVPVVQDGDMSVTDIWKTTAASRLAFLRPGRHLCVSWRMIEHLAMGAATVCDHAAYPRWPVPLKAGNQFIDCNVGLGFDESLPERADYERIADTVMDLLEDPGQTEECRRASAQYFDAHVAPARIARYVMDVARVSAYELLDRTALAVSRTRRAPAPAVPAMDQGDTGVPPSQTSLLEFTHDAVIIWEMNGRGITYWNQAAEQLYGYSREEARGQTTHTLLATHLAGGGVNSVEETLARYGVWVGELQHTSKSGARVTVAARLAVLSQANGKWLVLEVNRNVTDRQGAEAQSAEMVRQLGQLRGLQKDTVDAV